MRFEVALLFVLVALLATYLGWTAGRARPRRRLAFVFPPNYKIIWNPYTSAWTWAQQSQLGVWNWKREATTAEIARFMTETGAEHPNNLLFLKVEGIPPAEFPAFPL